MEERNNSITGAGERNTKTEETISNDQTKTVDISEEKEPKNWLCTAIDCIGKFFSSVFGLIKKYFNRLNTYALAFGSVNSFVYSQKAIN